MIKIRTLVFLSLLFIFVVGRDSFAMKKVAQSKMQFLKLGVGARASAMGEAFTAQAGDPNSIFYNPAGCAYIKGFNVTLNQLNWIADISHQSAVLSYNTGRYGVFTANYITMNYGSMERTIVDAHAWEGYISDGTFSVAEYAVGLGYATNITDRFSIGAQAKYIFQNLGATQIWRYIGSEFETTKFIENEDDVVAYDFGTYYDAGFKGLRIGMAVQNFANKALPLTFRFGVAMEVNQLLFPQSKEHILTIGLDALHPRDYSERVHLGLEYSFRKSFYLRAGYKINYDEEDFSAGAGFIFSAMGVTARLDYSYTNFGVFGNVSRFTFNFEI